jgi:uncharacterized protein
MSSQPIIHILDKTPFIRDAMRSVESLNLPDCWVGAGLLRNCVWDVLHGYSPTFERQDVDVVFYDETDISEQYERTLEKILSQLNPIFQWSVKNQARMKIKYNLVYSSVYEAIAYWPETATCIAARLNNNSAIELIAPYGIDDPANLIVKLTPIADIRTYEKRLSTKKWQQRWPKLTLTHP